MVKAYLPKQRRFECVLDEEEEGKAKAAGRRKEEEGREEAKEEEERRSQSRLALRAENLVVRLLQGVREGARDDKAAGVWGLRAGALLRGELPEGGVAGAQERSANLVHGDGEGQGQGSGRKRQKHSQRPKPSKAKAAKASKAKRARLWRGGRRRGPRGGAEATSEVSAHSENRRQGGRRTRAWGRPTWAPRRRARLHMSSSGRRHFAATSRKCGGYLRAGPTSTLFEKLGATPLYRRGPK